MKLLFRSLTLLAVLTGCGAGTDALNPTEDGPDSLGIDSSKLTAAQADGLNLFFYATFKGNGRTCATCHSGTDGTINPAEVQARYKTNPNDPLFRKLDSDNGAGTAYTRLMTDATIRVTIPLPANVRLADDPTARSVVLDRGVPTTFNTPALDPTLMADGRAPNLAAQALDAVHSHYQNKVEPTSTQTSHIAAFEKLLVTNAQLAVYANGGAAPTLPPGNTDSEKRGRAFFNPDGMCGICHSGPMMNIDSFGSHFSTAFVSEFNEHNRPVRTYVFTNPDGTTANVTSPDPGRALITGNIADVDSFKTPQLWGIKNTAPYFHDNSAKTLQDVVDHYQLAFNIIGPPAIPLSDQDKADIVAYLKLL